MRKECEKCMCRNCGNMHSCEIIMENVILADKEHSKECRTIITCDQYTSVKDKVRHKVWNCDLLYGPKK